MLFIRIRPLLIAALVFCLLWPPIAFFYASLVTMYILGIIPSALAGAVNAAVIFSFSLLSPRPWHLYRSLHALLGGAIGLGTVIALVYAIKAFPAPAPWDFVSWDAFWKFQPIFFKFIFTSPIGVPWTLAWAICAALVNPWAIRNFRKAHHSSGMRQEIMRDEVNL